MWSLRRELRHHNERAPKCKQEVTALQFWREKLSFISIFEGTGEAENLAVNRAPTIKTELTKRIDAGGDMPPADVSVVIPCLNEAKSISFCVEKALKSFQAAGLRGEVVVADNGSTDGSIEVAERLGVRVVRVEQRGYGAALRAGIAASRGAFIIMGDADDSYDFSAIAPFVEKLREGYDLVMGISVMRAPSCAALITNSEANSIPALRKSIRS